MSVRPPLTAEGRASRARTVRSYRRSWNAIPRLRGMHVDFDDDYSPPRINAREPREHVRAAPAQAKWYRNSTPLAVATELDE